MGLSSHFAPTFIYHSLESKGCPDGVRTIFLLASERAGKGQDPAQAGTFISWVHQRDTSATERLILDQIRPGRDFLFGDVAPPIAPPDPRIQRTVDAGPTTMGFFDRLLIAMDDRKAGALYADEHHLTECVAMRDHEIPKGLGLKGLFLNYDETSPSATKLVFERLHPGEPLCALDHTINISDGAGALLEVPGDPELTRKNYAAAEAVDAADLSTLESGFDAMRRLQVMSFPELVAEGMTTFGPRDENTEEAVRNARVARISLLPGADPEPVLIVPATVTECSRRLSPAMLAVAREHDIRISFIRDLKPDGGASLRFRCAETENCAPVINHLKGVFGGAGGGHGNAGVWHIDGQTRAAFESQAPAASLGGGGRVYDIAPARLRRAGMG